MLTKAGMWIGIGYALGSAALFGASTPFAKALLGDVSPWLMAGLLYFGVGIGLGAYRLVDFFGLNARREAPLRRADLAWLIAVIVFGGVAGPVLLMLGLISTPASTAALLLNLESIATLAIAWLVYRENVDLRIGIGAAAILLGAVILSWDGGALVLSPGSFAIVGACLCWGIDNNLMRRLSGADPVQIAMIKGLAAGAVNITLSLMLGNSLPPLLATAQAMAIGFIGYGVSLVMFIYALRHLGSARTGAYFSLAPFIGAFVSVLAFGDTVSPALLIAGLLMALGLYLHLVEHHEHEHEHGPLAHEHSHTHDEHHQHVHAAGDPAGEQHTHWHQHATLRHRHPHYPDMHHRHRHR